MVTQPRVVTTITQPRAHPGFGVMATVFAVMSTIFLFSFGCWWSIPCTAVGIVLGITVSSKFDLIV